MDIVNEAVKLADEIADIIKNSHIYKDYRVALANIENDENTMEKIKQFKAKHLEYARERMNGTEDFGKEKYISQELYKILLNEDAKIFFKNEEELIGLIAEIYSRVAEKCYLNLFI